MLGAGIRRSAGGLFGLDERLVEAARGLGAKDTGEHLKRGRVFVGGGGDVVRDVDGADVADASQHNGALAILRRLFGPGRAQFARRAWNRAEILLHPAERFWLFEFPGDNEDDVVRLIILPVEGLEILDRHALNIAAIANGGLDRKSTRLNSSHVSES